MEDKTYYEATCSGGRAGYVGRLYKYDETGNRELTIHVTEEYSSENKAIDAITDWAEDQGYEPELA